ncbi:MAG: universal stress protein [Syntrophobacterales bacterium]|nr:MAG: universal stress protein [Syntrophobacterales bacterium]
MTDLRECDSPFGVFKGLLPLKKKMFDRVVFGLPASSTGWTDNLPDPGIPFTTKAIRDLSYREIMTAAKEEKVSCIVVDLDRDSHEAAIRELALKSPLPVLVIDRNASGGGLLDHVIFATDWSPVSEQAMEKILALGEFIYELDIIHVITEKLTVKDMRELKQRLEHTRKICLNEGISAESHIYAGDVAEEIVTASEDYRGSVIIVGSGNRRSVMERIFKKSTINNLIRNAAVPVFFIPFTVPTSRG